MPKLVRELTIQNPQGLHARPAAILVQLVSKYNSVVNIVKDGQRVNGSSIMGILTLGVQQGVTVTVEVDGDDAEDLMKEIETFLTQEEM